MQRVLKKRTKGSSALLISEVRKHLRAYGLSPREEEIVCLLLRGLSNKEIASQCEITLETVKDHLKHIYQKTGVHQRMVLVTRLLGTGSA